MLKARLFDFSLFFISLAIAYGSKHIMIETNTFVMALFLYLLFSSLYYHLRVLNKNGDTYVDYGISYSLSFGIVTGPLGLLIYEAVYEFAVYIFKRLTKKTVPGDFLDTFYNIGSFVTAYSIAYYLYKIIYPSFQSIPFGFWILICLLVLVSTILTSTFMTIVFFILGEFKTLREAIDWNIKTRNLMDMGKVVFTNGLLLLLLQEEKWEMIVALFILNYLVSHSFVSKAQGIQDKLERDQFEQMAYTDFLTGAYNRAFMDKKISELNQSGEYIGIAVADLDHFKQINDSYNHAVGDKVIQHFADTLTSFLSDDDILFRSGGEEFTIFLRNRTFEENTSLIENILQDLPSWTVQVEYNSEEISISYAASFGLYFYKVNEQVSLEKGYIYADNLLLQSKQLGRNRLSVQNGLITEHKPSIAK